MPSPLPRRTYEALGGSALLGPRRRGLELHSGGLPPWTAGSASASFVSRPARRSRSLRPACLLSRLQRPVDIGSFSRFVTSFPARRDSDCYRVEQPNFPGGTLTRWRTAPFHGARSVTVPAARLKGPIDSRLWIGYSFTPKALWPSAQGCRTAATLGNVGRIATTLTGLCLPALSTQGSACGATLGWKSRPRWGLPMSRRFCHGPRGKTSPLSP